MKTNCFTFSPLMGVIPGIQLKFGKPKDGGGVYPPQVSAGERYLSIDWSMKPIWRDDRLMSAQIRQIDSQTGDKAFNVLSRAMNTTTMLVMIDLELIPEGVKRKLDPSVINARVYTETDSYLIIRDRVGGKALIEFAKPGQSAIIFDSDGTVHRIVRQGDVIITVPYSIVEQAKERVRLYRFLVAQYRQRVAEGNKDVTITRLHGILGGLVRLLQVVVRHNRDAANILIDFLDEFVGPEMPEGMRKNIEGLLRAHNFPQAVMFAGGDFSNILNLSAMRDKFKGPPAEEKKRKQDRAAHDREVRLEMRGGASGQNTRQRASQHK